MYKLVLFFLIGLRLIFGQCPDLVSQFCESQTSCPTGDLLSIESSSIPFSEFNAICFGNFQSQGGDIQGRLAVKGDLNIARGFSLGALLTEDSGFPYSLVVGGNAFWGSGSLSSASEGIYAGGNFTGSEELSQRRTGGPCPTAGCLESELQRAQEYFRSLSELMSSLHSNVMIDNVGNLMCNSTSQVINVLDINDLRSLDLIQRGSQISGCDIGSILLINIRGNFDVNFTGSGFWQTSQVIYNVIGARTVNVQTQIDGLLLAPDSQLVQRGGVIVGNVIANGCTATQFNLACVPVSTGASGQTSGAGGLETQTPAIPSRESGSQTASSQESGNATPSSESQTSLQSGSQPSETQSQQTPSGQTGSETVSQSRSETLSQSEGSQTISQSEGSNTLSQSGGSNTLSQSGPITQQSGTQSPPSQTQVTGAQGVPVSVPETNCVVPLWESGFQCEGFLLSIENSTISFQQYDVIVFGNLTGNTGDIQGSVIVRNNVNLGRGFSIGDKLPSVFQYPLVVGGNLKWSSGALLSNITRFYAGNIELPAYLENLMQRIGIGCRNGDCLSQFFQRAHNCYSEISQALSRLQSNAAITVDSFRGLVRCDSNLDTTYITNISATLLSRILWYEFENCNTEAAWVINVLGNDNVTLQGGSFPARPNSLVYNILGSGRTLTVLNSAVLGSILAPMNNVVQPGGVIVGKVIAQNFQVLQVNRANNPGCESTVGQLREADPFNVNSAQTSFAMSALLAAFVYLTL